MREYFCWVEGLYPHRNIGVWSDTGVAGALSTFVCNSQFATGTVVCAYDGDRLVKYRVKSKYTYTMYLVEP